MPKRQDLATQSALCLDSGLAMNCNNPSSALGVGLSSRSPSESTSVGIPRSCRCLTIMSRIFVLVGSRIIMSLGLIGSSSEELVQSPDDESARTGDASIRLFTLRAISIASLSKRFFSPGPNGSR